VFYYTTKLIQFNNKSLAEIDFSMLQYHPMAKIIIYSTPTCHYCHLAKDYLNSKNIVFEEVNVAGNIEKQKELIAKSGQFGVPVIDIDGKIVIGFDRPKINQLLGIS